jgi:ATP-dependent Clp protease ATP-binding subunit ClpA
LITEKIVFNRLTYDHQLEIAQLLLDQELRFFANVGLVLTVGTGVLSFLVRRGFHPKLGARPLRDTVEKKVGDAVSRNLLAGGTSCGCIVADDAGDCLVIKETIVLAEIR